MTQQEIQVEPREQYGKGPARRERLGGRVPGVLYGHKEEPLTFTLDPSDFHKCLRNSGVGRNTVFKVNGLPRGATALIKDLQIHPVRRNVLHVDFLEVRDGDRLVVEVPVRTTGRAAGQVAGGDLQIAMRTIKLDCPAFGIPDEILIDVTPMKLNETVRIGDLPLPNNVKFVESERLAVVAIKESRRSKQLAQTSDGAEEPAGDA